MSKPDARDYRLLQTTKSAMDLLQQLVGGRKKLRGRPSSWPTHRWWTSGLVPAHKVEGFTSKMHAQHFVLASPKQKSAARAAGAASSYLVMRSRLDRRWEAGVVVHKAWVWDYTLVSIERREPQMRDAHRKATPVTWMERFELRLDQFGWSWYLTEAEEARLRHALRCAIREAATPSRGDGAVVRVRAIIGDVLMIPRYRGVRGQVISLLKEAYRAVRSELPYHGIHLPTVAEVERYSKRRRVSIYEARDGYPSTLGAWLDAWRADTLVTECRSTGAFRLDGKGPSRVHD